MDVGTRLAVIGASAGGTAESAAAAGGETPAGSATASARWLQRRAPPARRLPARAAASARGGCGRRCAGHYRHRWRRLTTWTSLRTLATSRPVGSALMVATGPVGPCARRRRGSAAAPSAGTERAPASPRRRLRRPGRARPPRAGGCAGERPADRAGQPASGDGGRRRAPHVAVAGRAQASQRARPRPVGSHAGPGRGAHHPRGRAVLHRRSGRAAAMATLPGGGPPMQAGPASPQPLARSPAPAAAARRQPSAARQLRSCSAGAGAGAGPRLPACRARAKGTRSSRSPTSGA